MAAIARRSTARRVGPRLVVALSSGAREPLPSGRQWQAFELHVVLGDRQQQLGECRRRGVIRPAEALVLVHGQLNLAARARYELSETEEAGPAPSGRSDWCPLPEIWAASRAAAASSTASCSSRTEL